MPEDSHSNKLDEGGACFILLRRSLIIPSLLCVSFLVIGMAMIWVFDRLFGFDLSAIVDSPVKAKTIGAASIALVLLSSYLLYVAARSAISPEYIDINSVGFFLYRYNKNGFYGWGKVKLSPIIMQSKTVRYMDISIEGVKRPVRLYDKRYDCSLEIMRSTMVKAMSN